MKRVLSVILVLTMCLTFAACSSTKKAIVGWMWVSDSIQYVSGVYCADYWVFEDDGTFSNRTVSATDYHTIGTMSGTYTVKNDTIYYIVTEYDGDTVHIQGELTYSSKDGTLTVPSTGYTYSINEYYKP